MVATLAPTGLCYEHVAYATHYNRDIRAAYVVNATSVSEVQAAVSVAADAGLKVRTMGAGWSWTQYFVDDAAYVRLTGGELTKYQLGDGDSTLTAGAGK